MEGSYVCDTCGRRANTVRRDVVDSDYNALSKPAMWNCEECYQGKRRQRAQEQVDGPDRRPGVEEK